MNIFKHGIHIEYICIHGILYIYSIKIFLIDVFALAVNEMLQTDIFEDTSFLLPFFTSVTVVR